MKNARAVFLDRDGTIIVDVGYPRDPAQVAYVPGAREALQQLARAGYLLVVVSNQSGVARGLIQPSEALAVHARFVEMLAHDGITLAGSYYCFHGPDDGCVCRKPQPGLFAQAIAEHQIDAEHSWVIGDKPSDLLAGAAVGARGVLLGSHQSAATAPMLPSVPPAAQTWHELMGLPACQELWQKGVSR